MLHICLIHSTEVVHGCEVDIQLQNILQARLGLFKDSG